MMTAPVRVALTDGIGTITLVHPPANTLGPALRRALDAAVAELLGDPGCVAILVTGAGGVFSAGTDPAEIEAPAATPTLCAICARIAAAAKPVVALIDGPALSGGAELALAAHLRLGTARARLGFPDIGLGRMPVAGATQRLPRLVGARMALAMLLGGRPVPAEELERAGLILPCPDGDPVAGARAVIRDRLDTGRIPGPTGARRDRLADGAAFLAEVARRRQALAADAPLAARRLVDSVEAALLLPFEAGLAFEADAEEACRADPGARALCHVTLAERRIPSALATRDPKTGKRRLTEAGAAAVARLRAALLRAGAALVRAGADPAGLNAALAAAGWLTRPFEAPAEAAPAGLAAGPDPVARCHGALVAEGARMIDWGLVPDAATLDVLAVRGLGFPRRLGGPMFAAEQRGLDPLCRDLAQWVAEDRIWAIPPLLARAARLPGGWRDPALTSLPDEAASGEDHADHDHDQPEE